MSNIDRLTAAKACYNVLMAREANACDETLMHARKARQDMQVYISTIRRQMREEKK